MLWWFVVSVTALCVSACVGRAHVEQRAFARDASEAMARLRAQEEAISSLRARFAAELERDRQVRRSSGVLLIKKPDRLRLHLLSPFGLTVFDYTSTGEHAYMSLPLEGKVLADAQIADQTAFTPADFRDIFLRADLAVAERCFTAAAVASITVSCRDAQGDIHQEMDVDVRTATITRQTNYAGGRARVVMELSDYRDVESVRLPFAIALVYPDSGVRMRIVLHGYEVNPGLPDSLFDPPPAGVS